MLLLWCRVVAMGGVTLVVAIAVFVAVVIVAVVVVVVVVVLVVVVVIVVFAVVLLGVVVGWCFVCWRWRWCSVVLGGGLVLCELVAVLVLVVLVRFLVW